MRNVARKIDELRKILTSANILHGYITANLILYPMLYREIGVILRISYSYEDVESWITYFGICSGLTTAFLYILVNDNFNCWYNPPYPRIL